ncbi:MAG TPA: hypothetical protein VF120_15245 [Ktedonobacterales bacterium]
MAPNPQPSRPTPTTSIRTGRALAWAAFVASLVFPVTYMVVALWALLTNVVPSGSSPFVAALYTVFDYFEWPLPLLAVILGHIVLARGTRARTLPLIALALGYLSILALLGTIIALAIAGRMSQP